MREARGQAAGRGVQGHGPAPARLDRAEQEAAGPERAEQAANEFRRVLLVVDGVEGGDEVEPLLLVVTGEVAGLETDVGEALFLDDLPSESDCVGAEVVADEPALREPFGERDQGRATTAAGIEDVDAGFETI